MKLSEELKKTYDTIFDEICERIDYMLSRAEFLSEDYKSLHYIKGRVICLNLKHIELMSNIEEGLKARFEKMGELPCKVGDTLFSVTFALNDEYDETGVLHTAGWYIRENTVTEKNLYQMCDLMQKHKAFTNREAAEARLKELQGRYGNVDNGD